MKTKLFSLLLLASALICTSACKKKITEQDSQAPSKEMVEVQEDRCKMKPDPGLCKARISRYFYNPKSKKCEEFFWGGCGGVVPFETLKECESCLMGIKE
ncbi:MAG: BPTI/Kunitz domain-containing protein [Bacteroidota bacterium]